MKILFYAFDVFAAVLRLLWLLFHFIFGISLLFIYRFRWGKQWFYTESGAHAIQKWMGQGCRVLGIDIQTRGEVSSGAVIMVANHISWLDIVGLAASSPVTFVSKSDLKRWPFVGVLAKFSGTVFIRRGSLFSMHDTLTSLVDILNLGRKTIFFPEGTTTRGETVKTFHSGLFETAKIAHCQVQPVAIRYCREGKQDRVISPYVDDDHFFMHLWRLLLKGNVSLHIDYLDEVRVENKHRREVADLCRDRISAFLEADSAVDSHYSDEVVEAEYVFNQ